MYRIDLSLLGNSSKFSDQEVLAQLVNDITDQFDINKYNNKGEIVGTFFYYTYHSYKPSSLIIELREEGERAIADAPGRTVAIGKYLKEKECYGYTICRLDEPETKE